MEIANQIQEIFLKTFASAPAHIVRAPGRVNPLEACARAYLRAVRGFFAAHPDTSLRTIRLCLLPGPLVDLVKAELLSSRGTSVGPVPRDLPAPAIADSSSPDEDGAPRNDRS